MIGQTLGHYRIESQLGSGGMGVVYRAYDGKLERPVAIKLVGERLASEATARDRLLREARTASSLNHPCICTVHEVGEVDGLLFIVMEHIEGRSLNALLSEPRPAEMVVRYGIQIADALAHAHERGVVHRDLKTGNVMLTPEGRIKVLDFGLAKRLPTENIAESPTRTDGSLTQDGQVVGTLHYIAPELLRGEDADARSDIWALGVVLYELAMGELPFQGKTRYEVTHKVQGEAPAPLSEKVPAGLRAIILRCMAKEPSQRYQRASEVRAALETIQSGLIVPITEPVPAPRPPISRGKLPWILGAAVLIAIGGWIVKPLVFPGSIGSVAVMPFVNAGGNPEQEYLSDGIAESVIASLSQITSLKVIAFGSVARYKGHDLDAVKIGRELKVAAVVTGRVERHKDLLVVRADLVDASDGRELWGQSFSRKSSDLASVENDISLEISRNLRQSLTGEERRRVVKHGTESSEAYELYLKGGYYHHKESPEDWARALDYYLQAIDKDPRYALAYSGLADLYASRAYLGGLSPTDASPKARAAARKAIEIDDSLPEVQASQAIVAWLFDWDWPSADAACQRAIALNPSASNTHFVCAQFSTALGRFDEAIARMKKAEENDPLSVDTSRALGTTYFWARRYDDAIAQFRKALKMAPQEGSIYDRLADVYEHERMFKEAIAALQQSTLLAGNQAASQETDPKEAEARKAEAADAADGLGKDFESLGFDRVLRQVNQASLNDAKEQADHGYVSPIAFAISYAKLGEADQAFAWLEKAYAERAPWLVNLKTDPAFDPIRSDTRFADLLRRIALPANP